MPITTNTPSSDRGIPWRGTDRQRDPASGQAAEWGRNPPNLRRSVRAIRSNLPNTPDSGLPHRAAGPVRGRQRRRRILIRADSHYCSPQVIDWCRANHIDFILGLALTKTLRKHVADLETSTTARVARGRDENPNPPTPADILPGPARPAHRPQSHPATRDLNNRAQTETNPLTSTRKPSGSITTDHRRRLMRLGKNAPQRQQIAASGRRKLIACIKWARRSCKGVRFHLAFDVVDEQTLHVGVNLAKCFSSRASVYSWLLSLGRAATTAPYAL